MTQFFSQDADVLSMFRRAAKTRLESVKRRGYAEKRVAHFMSDAGDQRSKRSHQFAVTKRNLQLHLSTDIVRYDDGPPRVGFRPGKEARRNVPGLPCFFIGCDTRRR